MLGGGHVCDGLGGGEVGGAVATVVGLGGGTTSMV